MKMFNLIRSPRAGTIAAVHVTELRVSQGDLLVTFAHEGRGSLPLPLPGHARDVAVATPSSTSPSGRA
jgi:hypothetical protein